MLFSCTRSLFQKSFSKVPVTCFFKTTVNCQIPQQVNNNYSTTKLATTNNRISREPALKVSDNEDVWLSKFKLDNFLSYFPGIVNELEAKAATYSNLDKGKRIRRVMQYVMPGANRYIGTMIAEIYKMLTPEDKHTSENLKLAYYLGWCYEIAVEALNITDDIVDNDEMRRNKVCWYKLPDVGSHAVNDALMIESGAYYLLIKHFGHLTCYARLVELFNETTFSTTIGQNLSLITSKDFQYITMENFNEMVINIAGYIANEIPVALGMTLAGYTDLQNIQKAKSVFRALASFYVIQNDFYDCFGGTSFTGKKSLGLDVKEGRCRWPILVALQHASQEQKDILMANYGQDDPECVTKVIDIYKEINIPLLYEEYINNLYINLMENVNGLDGDIKMICQKLTESLMYANQKWKPVFI